MSLIDLKSNLKDLKFKQFVDLEPYVSKDIKTTPTRSRFAVTDQIEKRKDDVVRLSKLLKDRPGLKFIANQGLLSLVENQDKIGKGKGLTGVVNSAKNVAVTVAGILAQAGLSGTGFHWSTDKIVGNVYLKDVNTFLAGRVNIPDNRFIPGSTDGNQRTSVGSILGANINVESELENKEIPDYLKSNIPDPILNLGPAVVIPSGTGEVSSEVIGSINFSKQQIEEKYADGTIPSVVINPSRPADDRRKVPLVLGIGSDAEDKKEYYRKTKQKIDSESIDVKFKMPLRSYDPVAGRFESDSINLLDINPTSDQLQALTDLIPFKFSIIAPNVPVSNLLFRAYLNNLREDYSGAWNSTQYIGRAESVYNYTGFSRNLSFSFMVAASSEQELRPLYRKLNQLAGSTSPSYSDTFMRGILTRITIGDYLNNIPGFISRIGLGWENNYPWEVADGVLKVPHVLEVDVSFTPIHNFVPELNQPYIGPSDLMN
jgi:hypothetical protein